MPHGSNNGLEVDIFPPVRILRLSVILSRSERLQNDTDQVTFRTLISPTGTRVDVLVLGRQTPAHYEKFRYP
jgi:hypothetical protein